MPKCGASQRRAQRPRAESCGAPSLVPAGNSSVLVSFIPRSRLRIGLRERGALRAEMGMHRVFTLGSPGHCDEGRAQNLIAISMAALTPSPFAFILHVFVASHTGSAFA